ncbi:hypothetical protein F511_27195 [Dorcoceras hygrometricum]|uniref:Uncharacterized protein n=1 Tax=Dorcoceras hygrometricum TaxID=472368 RepID=A0A2Z7CFV6_9LAMI|nr:hypothetical protein F511_27195 [Dorcoceras hygrometricum]
MGSLIVNNLMLAHPMVLGKSGEEIKGQNHLYFRSRRLSVRILKSSRIHYDPAQPSEGREDPGNFLEELKVPKHWLDPAKASEESEWLRVTLKKWLDDEYCPEETNVEISKVAASSLNTSLLEKRDDLGEILLKMAAELESISYQDSFHGAFSSANAAMDLIIQRISQP